MRTINIYCDESCHLLNDGKKVMALGAICCQKQHAKDVADNLKALKINHRLSPSFELKWTKISPSGLDYYQEVLEYFFQEKRLIFRALIVPDKSKLLHEAFHHDHDTWYYKMYFEMLKVLLTPRQRYCIYLDIKDTRSAEKVEKLHQVLCFNSQDYLRRCVQKVQHVRSHEVEQVQLADLLIGCIRLANEKHSDSFSKRSLAQCMQELAGHSLRETTPIRQKKVNLLHWEASEVFL